MVDKVEQALVGPVQVFEDEDERPLLGECLEEAPPRCKSLGSMVALELLLALEPDQCSQVPLDPIGLRLVDELAHAPCQLACRLFGRVRLEHACLRLHHLAERPKETPSPYGSDRPWRQLVSSTSFSITCESS